MITRIALTGLVLMGTSMAAQAVTPSYNFLDLNYVVVDRNHDATANGGELKVSGLIAPYVYFNAGYEYLENSESEEDGSRQQTGIFGLGGRLPLVANVLDLAGGLDYVRVVRNGAFEKGGTDEHDSGIQVSLGVRANFKVVEVDPVVRYHSLFSEEYMSYGFQVRGRLGYDIWLTAGVEHQDDTDDQRYTVGFRLYLDSESWNR